MCILVVPVVVTLFFFLFLFFFFYYSLILRCIYTLQAYRYRRVKKIVFHQLSFIINFRPTASLEHWFGSSRNNYGSIPLRISWDSRDSRGTSARERIALAWYRISSLCRTKKDTRLLHSRSSE